MQQQMMPQQSFGRASFSPMAPPPPPPMAMPSFAPKMKLMRLEKSVQRSSPISKKMDTAKVCS
jgi:hypothetical protein